MKIKEIREQREKLLANATALTELAKTEDREFTEEETATFDGLLDQADELKADLEKAEANQARRARLDEAAGWKDKVQVRITTAADPSPTASNTEPVIKVTGGEASGHFASLGEQLLAIRNAELPGRRLDERLTTRAITGSGTTIASDGGFLIETQHSKEILKRVYEIGAVTSRVRKLPLEAGLDTMTVNAIDETSRATGSRWGGVQVYRVAEGGTGTAKKPKIRQIKLSLKKLMGLWYATGELLKSPAAMTAVANQAFAEEFAWTIENEIINGDGVTQMKGILATGCTVSVTKETGQDADTIVYENIVKMWSRMWGRSRANAVWFINQDCEPQLNQMTKPVGTGGIPVYLPPGGLSQSPYGTLMGRPVIPLEQCSTVGTVGDIILADFSQYVTIDSGATESASSVHVRFLYDEEVFRWMIRNDGQPIWASALTPANGTNTLSPFITLASRD